MGFDLTESELKATRKLHGLDKEGNIEEDIEKIKQLNNLLKFFRTHGWIPNMSRELNTNGTIEAIEHMLAEREQDKKKIKELEEHLKKYYDGELYTAKQLKNIEENQKKYFINKQKVKDKIEELKNDLKLIACDKDCSKCFNKEGKALYRGSNFVFCYAYHQIKVLEELLEEK